MANVMRVDGGSAAPKKVEAPVSARAAERAAIKPEVKPDPLPKPIQNTAPAQDAKRAVAAIEKPKAPEPKASAPATPPATPGSDSKAPKGISKPNAPAATAGAQAGGKGVERPNAGATKQPGSRSAPDGAYEGDASERVNNLNKATQAADAHAENVAKQQREADRRAAQAEAEAKKTQQQGAVANFFGNLVAPVTDMLNIENPRTAWTNHDENKAAEADAKRDRQAANQAAIQAERNQSRLDDSLETATDINALVQSAHAAGLPESVVQTLDGASLTDFKKVQSVGIDGADATYNSTTKTVNVSAETLNAIDQAMKGGNGAPILDQNGFVVNPDALSNTQRGKDLLTTTTLVNHEYQHKGQDQSGALAATDAAVDAIQTDAHNKVKDLVNAGASPQELKAVIDTANISSAKTVVEQIEYQPNLEQELNDHATGNATFNVMLNADGTQLPKQQQLDNLWAMYTNKPMAHGPNAGQTMPNSGAPIADSDFAASITVTDENGGRRKPGRRKP